MFFLDPSAVEINILDESKVQSATRVTNYTPYFLEHMTFSHGMVGEAEEGGAVVEGILDDFEYEQTSGEEEEETAASARDPSSGAPESSTQKGRRAPTRWPSMLPKGPRMGSLILRSTLKVRRRFLLHRTRRRRLDHFGRLALS